MYSQNFNVQTNIRKRFISQIRERLTLIHNKKGIPHTDKIPIAAEALFLLQGNQEAIVPKESLRLYIKMMQSDDMNLFLESAEKLRQRIDAETLRDLIWFQHHLTYQNAPDSPLLGEDLIKQVTAQKDSLLRQFNALSIPLSHLEVQLKGNKIILSDKYKAVNKLLAAF